MTDGLEFKIKTADCLEALKKNLDAHIIDYDEASKGWVLEVSGALKRLSEQIDRKGLKASEGEFYRIFRSKPKDVREQYSRYISAFERCIANGQTEITMDEFTSDQIFNDNWDWSKSAKESNTGYTTSYRMSEGRR
jgi:hypothetical protein